MSGPFVPSEGWLPLPWRSRRFAVAAVVLAVGLALVAGRLPLTGASGRMAIPPAVEEAAARAEAAMRRAQGFLWEAKVQAGLAPSPATDPGRTGLIGDEVTELTTTLGSLSAKQTAAQPRWAAELVRRMWLAGVRPGNLVAAGFSGSFPGLNLAVVLACESLGVKLGAVSSVTASTFGANQPGFTWPEMEVRLARAGLIRRNSLAVSAGGYLDRAADLLPEGQALAQTIARRSAEELGAAFLSPKDFAASVEERLAVYQRWARGRRIVLYVNAGGTDASLGRSNAVLRLSSGFLPAAPFDFSRDRGVMARMAEGGVPLLHLLNVRDLAVKWGVPLYD